MSIRFGLSQHTVELISAVFNKYPDIDQVVIYGSRATGTFAEGSDIDLVVVSQKLAFSKLLQVKSELDDLMIPYKVDISMLSQINNTSLIEHIDKHGQVFYSKQ